MKTNLKKNVYAFIAAFTCLAASPLLAKTVGEKVDHGIEKTKEVAHDAKDKAKDIAHKSEDKAKEAKDKAKEIAKDTKDKAKDIAHKSEDKAKDAKDHVKGKIHDATK